MKNSVEDPEKLAKKLSDSEKDTIKDAIKDAQEWLDKNQGADKEQFDEQLKAVEAICNPIVSKVYQASGSAGGASDNHEEEDVHDDL